MTQARTEKGWRGWVRLVFFGAFLAVGACALAPPALAQCVKTDPVSNAATEKTNAEKLAKFLEELGLIGKWLSELLKYLNILDEGLKKVSDSTVTATGVVSAGQQAQASIDIDIANAKSQSDVQNTNMRPVLAAAAKMASNNTQQLCRALHVYQIPLFLEPFVSSVSWAVASAIEGFLICPTCDGDGPQYAAAVAELREGYGNPIDGYKGAAAADGSSGIYPDSDLSVYMMDGLEHLTLPKFEEGQMTIKGSSTQITASMPAPGKDIGEQRFMAAFYSCLHLAGSRPTPPWGEARETPTGITAAASYEPCYQRQSGAIKACSDLVAFYTRPSEKDHADLVKKINERCKMAIGQVSDSDIQKRFGECKQGLSLYESLLLGAMFCNNVGFYKAQGVGGGSHADMMKTSNACQKQWNALRLLEETLQGNLTAATTTLRQVRECWPAGGPKGRVTG